MSAPSRVNGNTRDIDLESQHDVPLGIHHQTPDAPLTLEQFRALVGIPQELPAGHPIQDQRNHDLQNGKASYSYSVDHSHSFDLERIRRSTIDTFPNTRPRILVFLRLLSRPSHPTSLYFSLLREESDQSRLYHIYNIITYACLILQLVIASALIIIGAIPSDTGPSGGSGSYRGQRIAVAILGAITGLLTGVMSLLKGQGLPLRFLHYASRLRQVRDQIEFMERTLRANIPGATISFQDVVDIWHDYQNVIAERDNNRPDAWASTTLTANTKNTKVDRIWKGQPPYSSGIDKPHPVLRPVTTENKYVISNSIHRQEEKTARPLSQY